MYLFSRCRLHAAVVPTRSSPRCGPTDTQSLGNVAGRNSAPPAAIRNPRTFRAPPLGHGESPRRRAGSGRGEPRTVPERRSAPPAPHLRLYGGEGKHPPGGVEGGRRCLFRLPAQPQEPARCGRRRLSRPRGSAPGNVRPAAAPTGPSRPGSGGSAKNFRAATAPRSRRLEAQAEEGSGHSRGCPGRAPRGTRSHPGVVQLPEAPAPARCHRPRVLSGTRAR